MKNLNELLDFYERHEIDVDNNIFWSFSKTAKRRNDMTEEELSQCTLRKQFPQEAIIDIDNGVPDDNLILEKYLESQGLFYLHKRFESQPNGHYHLMFDQELEDQERDDLLTHVDKQIGYLLVGHVDFKFKKKDQAIQLELAPSFSESKYPNQKQIVDSSHFGINNIERLYEITSNKCKVITNNKVTQNKTGSKTDSSYEKNESASWTVREVTEETNHKNYAFEEGISIIYTNEKLSPDCKSEPIKTKDNKVHQYVLTSDKLLRASDGEGGYKDIVGQVKKILHSKLASRMRFKAEKKIKRKQNYLLFYRVTNRHYKVFVIEPKFFKKHKETLCQGNDEEIIYLLPELQQHIFNLSKRRSYRSENKSKADRWINLIEQEKLNWLPHEDRTLLGIILVSRKWSKEKIKSLFDKLHEKNSKTNFDAQYASWLKFVSKKNKGEV